MRPVSEAGLFLRELCETLTWNQVPGRSPKVKDRYRAFIKERLKAASAAGKRCDEALWDIVDTALSTLTDEQIREMVLDPCLACCVLRPVLLDAGMWRAQFLTVFMEQLGIVGGRQVIRSQPLNTPLMIWRPSVGLPPMSDGGALQELSAEETNDLHRLLKEAAWLINRVAPAGAFVEENTLLMVVGNDSLGPKRVCSGSFRDMPGLSLILNATREGATAEEMADCAVHEAIHSAIYQMEACGVDVLRTCAPRQIASPWTGKTLAIESFMQACLVWFGLSHFWAKVSGKQAAFLHSRAIGGFMRRTYLSSVFSCKDDINQEVFSILLELPRHLQ